MKVSKIGMVLVVVMATAGVPGVQAADIEWSGGGGDDNWNNAGNWVGGVAPTNAADTAIFDSGAATLFDVDFTSGITNTGLRVRDDKVGLALAGHLYTNSNRIYVGDNSGDDALLLVQGGSLKMHQLYVSDHASATGTVVVTGASTVLESASIMYIGDVGHGTFMAESNAVIKAKSFHVGDAATASGTRFTVSNVTLHSEGALIGIQAGCSAEMLLSGAGTDWLNPGPGTLTVGASGTGTVTVQSGASISQGAYRLNIAQNAGSTGTLTVTNSGSLVHARIGWSVGGNTGGDSAGGTGTLNVVDGALATGGHHSSRFRAFPGSTVNVRDASINWSASEVKFDSGSTYGIELTASSKTYTATSPLISAAATIPKDSTNTIDGCNLSITSADDYGHQAGNTFRIFDYAGVLLGTFAGLADGQAFLAGGHQFQIDYGSGNNDEIMLTALPASGTVMIIR